MSNGGFILRYHTQHSNTMQHSIRTLFVLSEAFDYYYSKCCCAFCWHPNQLCYLVVFERLLGSYYSFQESIRDLITTIKSGSGINQSVLKKLDPQKTFCPLRWSVLPSMDAKMWFDC